MVSMPIYASISIEKSRNVFIAYLNKKDKTFSTQLKDIIHGKTPHKIRLVKLTDKCTAYSDSDVVVAIDNRSYTNLSLCKEKGYFTPVLYGVFLFQDINNKYIEKGFIKNDLIYTAPKIKDNIELLINNNYKKIGVIKSIKDSLSLKDIIHYTNLYDIEIKVSNVDSDRQAIKAAGLMSMTFDAVIIGNDSAIFNDKFFSTVSRISVKTQTPFFGGRHQDLIYKGLLGGLYRPFETNIEWLVLKLKMDELTHKPYKLMVNKKLESLMGGKIEQ